MDEHEQDREDRAGSSGAPARRPGRRLSRRSMLTTLTGVGAAGLVLVLVEPAQRLFATPARQFPDWVYTMPRGGEAYAAALANPELLAPLPCFCGCMRFEQPHGGLKDCFIQPTTGELDPHGAFCETCQDEALDAVALAKQGVSDHEIHAQIVAKYADRDPEMGGVGCGGATHAEGEGAACAP